MLVIQLNAGYELPIQAVLANDIYPIDTDAIDNYKPGMMFDSDTSTFYHAKVNSYNPGFKVYFGNELTVTEVIIVNRLDYKPYLKDLEDTVISVLKADGTENVCGTLTGVNTASLAEHDQTYKIQCGDVIGIGIKVEKLSVVKTRGWCISELTAYYSGKKI